MGKLRSEVVDDDAPQMPVSKGAESMPAVVEDESSAEQKENDDLEMLDRLGTSLAMTRSDAIKARAQCGIETEWLEDEEHYEGIDESNRGDLSAWRSKPLGRAALQDDESTGSTVFLNITRSYVDYAAGRTADMLIPTDEQCWEIDPTPIPDMVAIANGKIPERINQQIDTQVTDPEQNAQVKQQVVDTEKAKVAEAKEKAEKAGKQILDWHVECNYNAQMRLVIGSSAKIGTGIMKGPIPQMQTKMAFVGGEMISRSEIVPASWEVSAWNCFPDLSCGDDIQLGAQHWEKDDITERSLIALIDQKDAGYIEAQIRKAVKEGPHEAAKEYTGEDAGQNDISGLVKRDKSNLFEIWYYYGQVTRENLEAAGLTDEELGDDELLRYDAELVMVNNTVIRASRNPLESGAFPYDYLPWQMRTGLPFGISVGRQIRTPQRIINGAGRNLMDNAGMAGGPMWIYNQGLVEPLDGVYEIAPRKGWMMGEDAENPQDVANAFAFISMDMQQDDLQAIIQFGMRMAEQLSGLPSLMQGQQQESEQETLGSRQARRNDGAGALRRMARMVDDYLTTPQIKRYYEHLMLHVDDDTMKGDFDIQARGSSALVERDIQNQSIMDLRAIVDDPSFGLDKKKWAVEYLRSQRLDPKNFEFDDEEWKKVLEQMSAPPPDTSLQIAEMGGQIKQAIEGMKLQDKGAERQFKATEAETERVYGMKSMKFAAELETQLAQLKALGSKDQNIDSIKAALTDTIVKLKTQVQLAGQEREDGKALPAPQVATPPMEPEGRAPDGESYQK